MVVAKGGIFEQKNDGLCMDVPSPPFWKLSFRSTWGRHNSTDQQGISIWSAASKGVCSSDISRVSPRLITCIQTVAMAVMSEDFEDNIRAHPTALVGPECSLACMILQNPRRHGSSKALPA
jgi:hypothetical protein